MLARRAHYGINNITKFSGYPLRSVVSYFHVATRAKLDATTSMSLSTNKKKLEFSFKDPIKEQLVVAIMDAINSILHPTRFAQASTFKRSHQTYNTKVIGYGMASSAFFTFVPSALNRFSHGHRVVLMTQTSRRAFGTSSDQDNREKYNQYRESLKGWAKWILDNLKKNIKDHAGKLIGTVGAGALIWAGKEIGLVPRSEEDVVVGINESTPLFVERENAIQFLAGKTRTRRIIGVTGVEGSGKTELALAFGRQHSKQLTTNKAIKTVFVFHASNPAQLEREYLSLAESLKVERRYLNSGFAKLKEQVDLQLALRGDYLLVFDNLNEQDGYDLLKKYVPSDQRFGIRVRSKIRSVLHKEGHGVVVFTSRKRLAMGDDIGYCDLNDPELQFSESESARLIDKVLGKYHPSYNNDAHQKSMLSKNLGYLPFAINSAAMYIKREKITIKQYVDDLRQLTGAQNGTYLSYKDAFAIFQVTHALSINRLSDKAKRVLAIMSMLDPDKVERPLLESIVGIDANSLDNSLNELCNYQLIHLTNGAIYKMHRSVKAPAIKAAASMYRVTEIDCQYMLVKESIEFFGNIFTAKAIPGYESNALLVRHVEELMGNFEALSSYINQKKDYALLNKGIILLDAVANFHSFSANDLVTARTALTRAFNILNLQIDVAKFTKSTPKEAYNMLKSLSPELPATYVRILYSYGRLYFYNQDPSTIASYKGYLEIAKMMSEIMDQEEGRSTFEAILIERNGLLYLNLDSDNAQDLKDAVKRYEELLVDTKEYDDRGNKIIPAEDHHHQMICRRQLAKFYGKLALKATNSTEREENYQRALVNIIGDQAKGVKGAIDHVKGPIYKANVLNVLGDLLLIDWRRNDPNELLLIKSKLGINGPITNKLDLAEQVLKLAKAEVNQLKPTYTPADTAYRLARVYTLKHMPKEAFDEINTSIQIQETIGRSDEHADLQATRKLQRNIESMVRKENYKGAQLG